MSDYQKIVSAVKSVVKDELTSVQQKVVLSALSDLKKAYDRIQSGSGMNRMKGKGFWDWLKTAAGDVNKFLKETKLLSKVASPILKYVIPIAAGAIGTPVSGVAAGIAGTAASLGISALGYGKMGYGKKMRGGDSRLSINPPGQRLMGKGLVYAYNGVPTMVGRGHCGCGKMVGTGGSQFNSVSSEFGKISV